MHVYLGLLYVMITIVNLCSAVACTRAVVVVVKQRNKLEDALAEATKLRGLAMQAMTNYESKGM